MHSNGEGDAIPLLPIYSLHHPTVFPIKQLAEFVSQTSVCFKVIDCRPATERAREREREREPPGIARARWHIYIYVQYIYRQTVAWRALTGENSWNYPRMQCNAMHAIPPRAIRRYIEHREQASPSLPANVSFRPLVSSRFVSFRFASFRATLRYTFARPCISSLLQSLYIYVSMGQPHSPPPHLPNLRAVCVCYVRICNM